jgi:hypothetical protein
MAYQCLHLLCVCLLQVEKTREDVETVAANATDLSPFVVIVGNPHCESAACYIVGERFILLEELAELTVAVMLLIATYFVVNIQYPKPVTGTLCFLQSQLLHIKGDTHMPVKLNTFMRKLSLK